MFKTWARIAASQRFGLNQTDVFVVDSVGALQVMSVVEAGNWSAPQQIGPANRFVQGSPIAVSVVGFGDANPATTGVFAVDTSGTLNVATVTGGGNWTEPQAIGPANALNPGAPVAATPIFADPFGALEVFTTDKQGALHVVRNVGAVWSDNRTIAGNIDIDSSIATSQQFGADPNFAQTDVFFVNAQGLLTRLWQLNPAPSGMAVYWNGPQSFGPAGLFSPGAPLVASQQFGLNQTDVFIVDKNGNLQVMWVDGGGEWSGPGQIGPTGAFGSQAFLAVSQQFGLNQTDLFVVDKNGTLQVMWVDGAGQWNGPGQIGPAGLSDSGAPVAASQQFGLTQTDVFVVDKNGHLQVMWVDGAGRWGGPLQIG